MGTTTAPDYPTVERVETQLLVVGPNCMFVDEHDLHIVAVVDGESARVVVSGELDSSSAPRLIGIVAEVAQPPVTQIDVDCAEVEFLDSAGVRALIVSQSQARSMGCGLSLVAASPPVSRVLEMTGLSAILS
jgi:anti-sigma B factor antagonist